MLTTLAVLATLLASTADSLWIPGDNAWGSHGLWRVDAAHGPVKGTITLAGASELSYATGLVAAGDSELHSLERLRVLWVPLEGLSVAVTGQYTTAAYVAGFINYKLQQIGNPTVDAKYTWSVPERWPELGFGVATHLGVLTSATNGGLVGEAVQWNTRGLLTYRIYPEVELSANVGYQLDTSSVLLGPSVADVDRNAFGLGGPHHALTWGAGVGARIPVTNDIDVGPFGEITGAIGSGLPLGDDPTRLSCGAKVYAAENHRIEFGIGVDVRIAGDLTQASPGILPWAGFAQLSMHLFDHDTSRCDKTEDCPSNLQCEEHICVAVKEKEVLRTVMVERKTFVIAGVVVDADTGAPVHDAKIVLSGFAETPVGTDAAGAFKTFPLSVGEGLVQLTASAPNYVPTEIMLSRGGSTETKRVLVQLSRDNVPHLGTIRGSVRQANTGQPVAGAQLYVPQGNEHATADAQGMFTMQVRTGQVEVLISAPGLATQRRRLSMEEGEVIILNVDMGVH